MSSLKFSLSNKSSKILVTWVIIILELIVIDVLNQPLNELAQPHDSVIFINKYGKIISCDARVYQKLYDHFEIYWQVLVNGQWQKAKNIPKLRTLKPNGQLVFHPFNDDQFQDNVHNTEYQCLFAFKHGIIGIFQIKLKAVIEKPIRVQTENEQIRLGSNAVMRCVIPRDYQEYVHVSAWMTDNGHILLLPFIDSNDFIQENFFKQKYVVLSNGHLYISNVDQDDLQKRFRCQVVNEFTGERIDSINWARLKLMNRDLPKSPYLSNNLVSRNSFILENEKKNFLIHCPFKSWPEAKITWYYANGSDIKPLIESKFIKFSSNLLYFTKFTSKDNGKYICSANNVYGQGQYEIELATKTSFNLLLSSSNSNINVGQELTLNCSLLKINTNEIINSSFIKDIIWYKNMQKISYDHRTRLLKSNILNIRKFEFSDNGVYQCFFKISDHFNVHSWLQASLLVSIEERAPSFEKVFSEQIEISGSDISLECLALGQPIPSIKWKIDGIKVTNNRRYYVQTFATTDGKGSISTLNVSSINHNDSGNYECLASNLAGSIFHQARIHIVGPPGIKPIKNMTAIQSQTFTLHCPYIGYPIDDVYFTKDEKKMPFNERHIYLGLGKVNITSISKEDEGLYKCVVVLLNSEKFEAEFELKVIVPPILNPFLFPNNLEEGMRISIVCSVISGDSPIVIKWFKDGQLIDSSLHSHYQIANINEYVSSLVMNKIDKYYSGNYTCQSSNNLASVNYSSSLMIKSRPSFILKPIPKISTTESSVLFDCQAEGYPESVIRWKFLPTLSNLEPIAILSSPRIHVLENGSLLIKFVTFEDEGDYYCEASNNIAKSVTVSTTLKVYEPPKILPMDDKIILKKGQKVDLLCHSTASSPFTVEWFQNSEKIISNYNYFIKEEGSKNKKTSTLTIKSPSRDDTALFRCVVTNFYKQSVSSIKMIIQEPSDPPINLQILQIKSKSVSVSWSVKFNGNSPIIGYEIEYRKSLDSWSECQTLYTNENRAYTVTLLNLIPMTSYHLRIRAENEIGKSNYSESLHFITRMEAPNIVPENVTTLPLDSRSIKVKWIININSKYNHIDGFYIGYKEYGSLDAFNYKTMHISKDDISLDSIGYFQNVTKNYEFIIDSLQKSTKYLIIVQAFNKEGEGYYSNEVAVETFANDPPKPLKLLLENSSTNSALLIWNILPQEEDSVDGFIVSYKSEKYQENNYDNIKLPKTYRKYLLTNLNCGTKYSAKIAAFNQIGNSEPSSELKFTTEGKAPSAGKKHAFILSNITSVVLNLKAWFDGNCPISHFKMQYKPRLIHEWILFSNFILPEQEKVRIENLIPGTWYDLLVTAKNDAGTTEANYLFATLTLNGATVAPLLLNEYKSFFGSVMVLIPSISAVIVLFLVAGFAIYLVFFRNLRTNNSSTDQYISHSENTFSLHSYQASKLNTSQDRSRTSIYLPAVYSTCVNNRRDFQNNLQSNFQRNFQRPQTFQQI